MSRTARLAAVTSAGALLVFAGSAHAATPGPRSFSYTDPAGDAAPLKGDIVKVSYTTTGTKTRTSYTPKKLVITLTTADAIDTSGGTTYEIDSDLAGCESGFDVYVTPGTEGSDGGGCTNPDGATSFTSTGVDGPPVVGAKTITWTITLKADPAFKPGSVISGIDAYTGAVDPVTGFVGPYLLGFSNDDAPTKGSYKIG